MAKKNKPITFKINLVPKDPFFNTLLGKTLKWALSVGRYIVIFTELVVILSFVTRFSLDRQVTDLNGAIEQKRVVIQSFGDLESSVRLIQAKVENFVQIEQQTNIAEVFPALSEITPQAVTLDQLTIQADNVSFTGIATTQEALNTMITNIQLSQSFYDLDVQRIETSSEGQGLEFALRDKNEFINVEKNMELNRKEVTKVLNDFYHKPVAMVSLELFLSIAAVVFFALFAIRPTLLTMSDLVKEIEDKRQLDRSLQQKIAALATVQTTYLSLQERFVVLDEAIPNSPQFIDSLKILERLASDRSLVITSVTVNEIPSEMMVDVTENSERVALPMSLTVTGDYPAIRGFIEDVLQIKRSFIIDTITFSKSDDRGFQRLDANITIGLPYFSEMTPTATGQTPAGSQPIEPALR